MSDWNWQLITQAVAAVAGCVGALAAWAAAIAAWRSARASRQTSEDAMRALAIGVEPRLTINAVRGGDPPHDQVFVENQSEWDARSVEVHVQTKTGEQERQYRERLRPLLLRDGNPTGDLFVIDLGPAAPARR